MMIAKFPGKEKIYYSHVSVDDDSTNNYPLDFLNSITLKGLPPLRLRRTVLSYSFEIWILIMDFANGTWLVVKAFEDNAIYCRIINEQHG